MIRGQMFSRQVSAPGQVVLGSDPFGNATTSWVVPAGVFEISAVIVSSAGGYAILSRGGTTLLSASSSVGVDGVGGGNGGPQGTSTGRGPKNEAGAGGAGGYLGSGGAGGSATVSATPGWYTSGNGSSGESNGGGGGGGSGNGNGDIKGPGGSGGGVTLMGFGGGGTGGAGGTLGGNNIGSPGGNGGAAGGDAYGAGKSNSYGSTGGGNLRYKNSIAVTPGESLSISMTGGYQDDGTGTGTSYQSAGSYGGLRIIWGGGRSYPSNALNA